MHTRKLLLPTLLLTALCATAQQIGELVARPIKYTCIYATPEGEKLNRYGTGIHGFDTGCQITYLLSGDPGDGYSVATIDSQGLTIISMTDKDGNALSQNVPPRQKNAWPKDGVSCMGSSSYNEKAITFDIFVRTEEPMIIPIIKGKATAMVGGGLETQTLTFKTDDKETAQEAGPLTFSLSDPDKGKKTRFGGSTSFGTEHPFNIYMKGDRGLVKKMTVKDADGKEMTSRSTHSYDKKICYGYSAIPATPEFTITVTYFTTMQDVPVTLGQPLPPPAPVPKFD